MADEVSQFLEQVERLRGQQAEEDETRARELEDYLAAKRERQARREERARSISPQKSSPVNTPSPRSNRRAGQQSSDRLESPTTLADKQHLDLSALPVSMEPLGSPTKENEAPLDSTEAKRVSTADSRSSTLSWQRRPNSRPLSMVAAQNATQRSMAGTQDSSISDQAAFSHEQMAQTLASKDPSWFRQTADRGFGSAANRRSQVDDDDRLDMTSAKTHQLPGMTIETPRRPSSPTPARLGSPVALKPHRPEHLPADDKSFIDQGVTSPPGRTSPVRSTSPTKGVGGFVQSAMMKRSDSVKRWSVTSPPGLTRAESVAANRNSHDRTSSSIGSRPTSGHSHAGASSRPTSSQGEDEAVAQTSPEPQKKSDRASKPDQTSKSDDIALPSSPTKTMDPRRWSPTKSSWLESALNRPESPTKTQPKPKSQPAWMVELNKARAERANSQGTDTSRNVTHKHQVSIGGLMRQSPVGEVAKTNPTGLGGIYSPPASTTPSFTPRPVLGHESKPSLAESIASETSDVDGQKRRPSGFMSQTKPKPEAVQTKDFRAGLRQRPAGADGPKSGEPEFKNVFGNLRRTRTQNYVAPDELKDNILRGKAALSTTDGPRKNEQRDDFKEAIQKKREDFKKAQADGKGVTRSSSGDGGKQPLEGMAKRLELKRSMTGSSTGSRKGSLAAETSLKDEAQESSSSSANASPTIESTPQVQAAPSRVAPPPSDKPLPEQPTQRGSGDVEATKPVEASSTPTRAGAKLAGRLNPALAGMLARGPPPMAATNGTDGSGGQPSSASGDGSEPTAAGPQLTHMTKSRARGPKRKAPTSSAVPAPSSDVGSEQAKEPRESKEPKNHVPSPDAAEKPAAPLSIQQQVAAQAALRSRGKPDSGSSSAPDESPASVPVALGTKTTTDGGKDAGLKVDVKKASQLFNGPTTSTAQPVASLIHRRTGSRSPTKQSSTAKDESLPSVTPKTTDGEKGAEPGRKMDVKRASRIFDEKTTTNSQPVASPLHRRTGSRSPTKQTMADGPNAATKSSVSRPTTPLTKPTRTADAVKSPSMVLSPGKATNELSKLLTDFFGPPVPRKEMRVDTAELLMSRPIGGSGKITSLGFQMFRIFGDGKKVPVSAQNERVLFEQDMYVCAHNFTNQAGKKMFEVYFWVGDEVPEATAQDAQLFVQREAKSLGGTLVRLQQGRETAEFLAALGGVVMVRRGTSNKYDSLAPNMLCGRRYLGQVAFDEVDFSPSSLCSGFTYLMAQAGKCFLWKGKGSDVAEVSCARLVGIDLSLTGELIECDDGSEPAAFWDMFDKESPRPQSAAHWRLKPSYDKYRSRLFCSDAGSDAQLYEIHPFAQADLSPSHIYILDAFFELYIIIGSKANTQYASFRNALDFAQEYAILAAGIEDRPFVPVSSVVLEGAPRDLKRVFRKWDDKRSPTATAAAAAAPMPAASSSGSLRRGRSLRVVTLTQALQAVSSE
ncbi:hypothetical protein CDD80_7247 [Ophiocordyceps camponoti-rufipedis]|uniref:DUF4045 domain-containing protein n=1 Tax=Ophiocordyceps camponoti-rufipedis TaxID=2004952 RepID=A0A2C5YM43_9HYPO|nr:hypothetical protein CDD80_7247 [Ophiocordyceps camponoti-rufipedis]